MSGKRRFVWGTTVFLLILACSAVTVFAADAETEYVPGMYATFWSLIPPVVAIVLALITKEVYSSLFIGILIGGVFYAGFDFERTVTHVFQDGIVGVLSDSYKRPEDRPLSAAGPASISRAGQARSLPPSCLEC